MLGAFDLGYALFLTHCFVHRLASTCSVSQVSSLLQAHPSLHCLAATCNRFQVSKLYVQDYWIGKISGLHHPERVGRLV